MTMNTTGRTLQREYVPIIRQAIERFRAQLEYEGDYKIDGYCVLVARYPGMPQGRYEIGLYLPGSAPDGTCDGYWTCDSEGEEVESRD